MSMSANTPKLDYYTLYDLFFDNEVIAPITEVHGVLCGLLCGGMKLDDKSWISPLSELCNDGIALPEAIVPVAQQLAQTAISELTEQKGVPLLLPSDESPLDERLEALAEWVQAFLAGFASLQPNLQKASTELQEMINDMAAIARLSAEFDPDDSENEQAYSLICDHINLGVMLAFEEFGERKPAARPTAEAIAATVH